jgi:hypothetical protein
MVVVLVVVVEVEEEGCERGCRVAAAGWSGVVLSKLTGSSGGDRWGESQEEGELAARRIKGTS